MCYETYDMLEFMKHYFIFFSKLSNKPKEAEAVGLEHVNRIDILFDRLVDFPRRCVQLLESYLKNLDVNTKEHNDIESIFIFYMCFFGLK